MATTTATEETSGTSPIAGTAALTAVTAGCNVRVD
jgi:hypothetical protein